MTDLSTIEARKDLVAKFATKYSIDAALVCAVIDHETGGTWDTFTSRYEPDFYRRYISDSFDGQGNPIYKTPIPGDSIRSRITEATQRAASYGLMQVLGEVARELGYAGRYLVSLCDPEVGLDFGCKKLKQCLDKNGGDVAKALLSYNGGANALYPGQVMALMSKYQ